MKRSIFFIVFLLLTSIGFPMNDPIETNKLQSQIEILSNRVDEVKRDQLNYSIEKDLIKATYSNNYGKINLFITGILLVFGFLGFFGLRDLNALKKEYGQELDNLRKVKLDLESKSMDFEQTKVRYDENITKILIENEAQNKKLKVLEIKEKLTKLLKEGDHTKALEFCTLALEFAPNDVDLLITKARIYSRTYEYLLGIKVLNKCLEIEPDNSNAIINLTELYIFSNQKNKSDNLINQHSGLFDLKEYKDILSFFEILNHFNNADTEQLNNSISKFIDKSDLYNKKHRLSGWDLFDAYIFIRKKPETKEKKYLQNYLWYVDGQINAKQALESLKDIPDKK